MALPGASEKLSHGEPTWFVKKVFCAFSNNHHGDGHVAVCVPAASGVQEALVAADEVAVVVADQSAGQQVRFDEDLEAVADAEHRHPGIGGRDDLGHDRRAGRDGAAAQVVAVAETTGEHDRVDALEVVVAVPERDGLGTRAADGALRIPVVERAGEGDDADLHAGVPSYT